MLAVIVFIGGGCTAAPKLREQLRVEFAQPDSYIERATNTSGRITFADASRHWAECDSETMQQVTKAISEGADIAEAKSWVWPRTDVEFGAATAIDRNNGSLRSSPFGELVLNYDFTRLLFHSDAAAVSAAGRDLCLQRARLAIDSAVGRFEDLVIDWRYLREAVPLENQRVAEFHRLMESVRLLDRLGTLPPGSFAEWNHREQAALREQSEASQRLESVLQLLRTGLGLSGDAEPDLGSLEFLLNVPLFTEGAPGEADVRQWLPGVWQSHPACRAAEIELFQAEMGIIEAKRERLPRLTGSIGLGDVYTRVGRDIIEASGLAQLALSVPLFDAGTIRRKVEKASLRGDMARRNLRIVVRSLVREVQSASAALRTAHGEADHRRAEAEEIRRLVDVTGGSSGLGQGDPLLPLAMRVYRVEAELSVLEANMKLAKAWRDYRVALGEQPVPGLSSTILDSLIADLGKNRLLRQR
ncbi:MAG: TolC family protein [Verrucomicrobiia bacterium]